ncbi:restriction endonuclease subunit S [Stieleria sp. ICT_E10.1]|uniref:restriction endonuclease subunit S n=1 Tax=Stieleria sedimenti TaxID=2976331 RepID=UPI0021807004|nr:restriction endonuclease subunit S [Stieleria sedimenti]MCS7468518.1 restriction endonuclease subunit S [Stieleria sedimenti]
MAGENGWARCKIGDIFDITPGFAFKSRDFSDSGTPVVKIKNVKAGEVVLDNLSYVDPKFEEQRKNYLIRRGDILITLSGNRFDGSKETWVGKVAEFRNEGRFLLNQRVAILRPKPNAPINSRCCAYLMGADEYQHLFIAIATSSGGQANLSSSQVLNAEILVPPLAEQQIIAHILGTLDDKIELNRRMNETLESMARAIFKSWFVDFDPVRAKMDGRQPTGMDEATAALFPDSIEHLDGELVPSGWEIGPLSELAAEGRHAIAGGPFGSKLSRKHYTDFGVPVIRGANMSGSSSWFNDRDFVFVSDEKATTLTTNMALPGDVVFTQRGTLGQVAIIPTDASFPRYVISQSQMKMTCAEGVPGSYVFLYFSQSSTVAYILANATASGVPHINLTFLRKFPILIPDRQVLDAFGGRVEPLVMRITSNERESGALAALRDALLPRLLSGKLRVGDAMKQVDDAMSYTSNEPAGAEA